MDDLQLRARAAYLALDKEGQHMAVAILEAWAAPAKTNVKPKPIKAPVLALVPRPKRQFNLRDSLDGI